MGNNTLNLLVLTVVLLIVVIVFIRVAIRLRKYGGSLTSTMFGATYEFLNKDRKEAVEQIIEMKANNKMEEDASGKTEKK